MPFKGTATYSTYNAQNQSRFQFDIKELLLILHANISWSNNLIDSLCYVKELLLILAHIQCSDLISIPVLRRNCSSDLVSIPETILLFVDMVSSANRTPVILHVVLICVELENGSYSTIPYNKTKCGSSWDEWKYVVQVGIFSCTIPLSFTFAFVLALPKSRSYVFPHVLPRSFEYWSVCDFHFEFSGKNIREDREGKLIWSNYI